MQCCCATAHTVEQIVSRDRSRDPEPAVNTEYTPQANTVQALRVAGEYFSGMVDAKEATTDDSPMPEPEVEVKVSVREEPPAAEPAPAAKTEAPAPAAETPPTPAKTEGLNIVFETSDKTKKTVIFPTRPIGITFNNITPIVLKRCEGLAKDLGVEPGWRMLSFDDVAIDEKMTYAQFFEKFKDKASKLIQSREAQLFQINPIDSGGDAAKK